MKINNPIAFFCWLVVFVGTAFTCISNKHITADEFIILLSTFTLLKFTKEQVQ